MLNYDTSVTGYDIANKSNTEQYGTMHVAVYEKAHHMRNRCVMHI